MRCEVEVRYEMRATLAPTLEAIEEFVAEFRGCVGGRAGSGYRFSAELLLREALTNAVVHGCCGDSSKRVRCVLRLRNGLLTIAVRDPGAGFDWRAKRAPGEPGLSASGRGLEILKHYALRVRFNRKGNLVTMIQRFS